MTSVCYFSYMHSLVTRHRFSCEKVNLHNSKRELGTPVEHSNVCGKSEKGSGFGGLDDTPPPKIPGNSPQEKKNSTFKPNLIQIELTKKEHFLLFCSYLSQCNSITVIIVMFSNVDKFH